MKKLFNAILIMGLFLMTGYFLIPVYAEGGTEEVIIQDVRQNNSILEYSNNAYQISDYRYNPQVLFYVKNAKKNTYYNVYFYSNEDDYSFITVYNKSDAIEYYKNTLNLYNKKSNYTVKLCLTDGPESKTCTEEISTKTITLNYEDYDKLNFDNTSLVVTKVMQGEEEIIPTLDGDNYNYDINNLDDVKVSLKGNGFDNTLTYEINVNDNKIYYSGSLLNDGITISSYPFTDNYLYLSASFSINNKNLQIKKENDGDLYNVNFNYNFNKEDNLDYTVTPSATHIDPVTYQNNKKIDFRIKTNSFEDRDYQVKVYLSYLISGNKLTVIHSEDKILNGLTLNNGYDYTISDVALSSPSKEDEIGAYSITVVIENNVRGNSFFYKGNGTVMSTDLYYGDGTSLLKPVSGMGYPVMSKGGYQINMLAQNNDRIFIKYKSASSQIYEEDWIEFDNDKEYNYVLKHGYVALYPNNAGLENDEILKTGTVTGTDLNNGNLMLEATFPSQILSPSKYNEVYQLTIYDGEIAVTYAQSEIVRNYNPAIVSYELKSNNQVLTAKDYNHYLVPNEYPLEFKMTGLGFEEDKEYVLKINEMRTDVYDCNNNACDGRTEVVVPHDDIIVTGHELNNGYILTFAANEDDDIKYSSFSFSIDEDYGDSFVLEFYDKDKEEIQVVSIMQDDTELTMENGKYIVNDPSKRITLKYKFKNIKDGKKYDYMISTFGVENNRNYLDMTLDNDTVYTERLYINPANNESSYTIYLCKADDEHICNKQINSKEIAFSLTDFNEYNYLNSRILVTKVMQGGNEINPEKVDGIYKYNLNDIQNAVLTIKGENLKSDAMYYVGYTGMPYMEWNYISGSSLMTGFDINISIKNNASVYFEASLPIFPGTLNLQHQENDDISDVSFEMTHDEDVPDYEFDITYKDEQVCVPTIKSTAELDPATFVNKHGIDVLIKGTNYLDKNYNVNVKVLNRNQEEVYNESTEVNGLSLNEGYRYYLNNLSIELRDNIEDFYSSYYVVVVVNSTTNTMQLAYNSSGSIDSKIYYSNNVEVIRNADYPNFQYKPMNYQIKYLNSNIINTNNKLTLKYTAKEYDLFNDSYLYNYEIVKGTMVYDTISDLTNKEVIDSGTVRGNILNTTGINKDINIPLEFNNNDAYMLVIKNGNEIVNYDIIQFRLTNDAMIIVNKLYDGKEEITNPYKGYEINYYHDIKLHLLGTNFDNDKTYTLYYSRYDNYTDGSTEYSENITGNTLNSGYDYSLGMVTNENIIFGGMTIEIKDGNTLVDTLYYSFNYVEKYIPSIKINTIKQNNNLLEIIDGKYIIPSFDQVYVNYEIEGYDLSRNYYIKIVGPRYSGDNTNRYDPNYHEYPILFSREQIEANYEEEPICPIVDGYTNTGRTGLMCNYQKQVTITSNPTCPEVEDYDFVVRDGEVCNYQRAFEVQVGVEMDGDEEVPVFETQYDYVTRDAICEEEGFSLNNGVCVKTTINKMVRDVECQNGTLEGNKCKLDTSNGYFGTYTYMVCADEECNRPYDSVSFDVNYQMSELINDSKLYVEKVMQGNAEIALSNDNKYHVNDLETVYVTLKGVGLNDDTIYYIGSYYNTPNKYSGSELNSGVTLKLYSDSNHDLDLTIYNVFEPVVYAMSHDDNRVSLAFQHDNSTTDFTYQISYLNNQDNEIVSRDDYENDYYFNSNYFNKDNPLKIRINSDVPNVDDDYDVKVSIVRNNQTYYENTVTVKGNRLTSGYEFFVNNLDLPFVNDFIDNNASIYYNLNIEVGTIGHQAKFIYNSIGNSASINTKVYLKNEKQHLDVRKGRGAINWGGGIYVVSDRLFIDHNSVYIKYSPMFNYQDDVTYSYTLEYFDNPNDFNMNDRDTTIIKSGTIKGSDFNTFGLTFEVNNPNNYELPIYGLTIKNGDEVLYMATPGLELKNTSTLTWTRILANNTDATYTDYNYIIPRDREVYGVISGIGFDDDKEYKLDISGKYYINKEDGSNNEPDFVNEKIITVSGYDLNHDGVKFLLDSDVSEEYTYAVYGTNWDDEADLYFVEEGIRVQYRDPDPEIGEYEALLTYHNEDTDVYYVEPGKFNNGGLDIIINGEGYQDKKYPVVLRITQGENVIYQKESLVEGLSLNEGYHLYLDDLILELNKNIPDFMYSGYNVDVIINNIHKNLFFTYNSRGEVIPRVYYNDTIKEAKQFAGSGEVFADYRLLKLNRNRINQNNQLTIKYQGYMFDNNKNYTYDFINGVRVGDMYTELTNQRLIDKGTVSGSTLNNEGIIKKITINPSAFDENERYLLIIRSGEEIVYYSSIGFSMVDTPMITNYDLSVDKNVITKNRNDYLLNYHTDATMMINGIDFDDNKDYRIKIEEQFEDYCNENDNCVPKAFEYVVKGSKLNNGFNYSIITNDNEEIEYKYIYITVIDIATEEEIDWTNVYIKYATPVYFFDEETAYTVDEETSVVKDIKKETDFLEFINNLTTYEGISVKLFDATGKEEITSNIVGTGMLLKVLDEESYESFVVPIVIKGDITGDGHISISDIIKVKKHLIDLDILKGVYELAGDVTDTGKVTTTDLVKMAMDLAKIAELD